MAEMNTKLAQSRSRHYGIDLQRYYRMPSVQISLSVVLSLFLIAFFLAFAIRPTISSIITLQKTIEESKATIVKLDSKVTSLQRAAAVLEALKPVVPYIDTSIVSGSAGYKPLTTSLEILAIQSGVRINTENIGGTLLFSRVLTPFALNRSQAVVEMPITIQVAGPYLAQMTFLRNLMSLDRIVSPVSVGLATASMDKAKVQEVTMTITGKVFYMANQAQLNQAIPKKKGAQ